MSNFFLDSVKSDELDNLNDINDLTRMAYQNKSNDIPLKNNSMTDRFESDTFINHKESFETNNKRINSLNDEIRELKDKLKLIYEKDEKIYSQKCELEKLNSELENMNSFKNKNKILIDKNISLKAELDFLKIEISDHQKILDENNLLKKKLIEINKNDSEIESEEIIETEGYQSDKIKIDLPKIKSVLYTRLKTYHEKHIDNLMNQYDLENKKELDKKTMEKLLLEAIHFN
tara:strand:- start:2029 stop:2724 length:696 start_codon:yes stop_codon:yes gene_type:complete